MLTEIMILVIFTSIAVEGTYGNGATPLSQPLTPTMGSNGNPKQECYQIYQGSQQPPVCAPFMQYPTTTIGIITDRKQDVLKPSSNLVKLIQSIPNASEKLASFLEYRGITQPWQEVLDFNSDGQRSMPAPEPMFSKIQSLLEGLESVKEFISNELFKVEKYVRRANAYLAEIVDDLKRYHASMKEYLRKMKVAKTPQMKSEYALRFSELHTKTQEKIKAYFELKKWIETMRVLFRSLF